LDDDMTEESARRVANVVLGAAAVGAAYVIVTTPPLRRLAWRLAVVALTGAIPAWLRREIEHAWRESSSPSRTRFGEAGPPSRTRFGEAGAVGPR
jgi:hypothetical protein